MNGNTGLRIISALVLVAAIAGVAIFAFQAGVAKGSPVTIEAPAGQPAPYPYYGMPFYHPWGWGFGFGFLGFLIPIFLFFLALRALRFLFWGPGWRWGYHHRGPWGRGWENGVPPMFEEWHKRAHNVPGGSEPKE